MAAKGQILVVDDEELIEQMMQGLVGRFGCAQRSFNDPKEALGYFRENHEAIDLAIVDLTMPGMTGIELATELEKIQSGLPVVLMTGAP